jgi:hypothetical protein
MDFANIVAAALIGCAVHTPNVDYSVPQLAANVQSWEDPSMQKNSNKR